MRITFVVHQFPPRYFTGTEQYALAVGCELQRRGHDVDVFALDPAFGEATGPWRESREVVQGLPVRRINFWMNLGRDWARMEYSYYLLEGHGLDEPTVMRAINRAKRRFFLRPSYISRHLGDVARLAVTKQAIVWQVASRMLFGAPVTRGIEKRLPWVTSVKGYLSGRFACNPSVEQCLEGGHFQRK